MKKHLLLTSLFLLATFVSQAQWEPDVRLTDDPGSSQMDGYPNSHCVASNGDTVHVVWKDNRDGASNEIYYKRSTDGGLSWGSDTRISNNIYISTAPSISVSGSLVIIVWSDKRDGISDNNYEVYYSRSTDGGTSWGTETRLTNDPAQSDNPCVSVSGSLVLVVWDDYRDAGILKTYYKRSTDGGINWGTDTMLTDEPGGGPSVSVSGSLVHVVWNALGKTRYKRSADGGLTWGTSVLLTIDNVITNWPSLSVSGSSVNIIWLDSRNNLEYEIYYKYSTDGGITWEADTRLTTNYTSATLFSSIAASGSNVHVVWDSNRDGNYEIYYIGSTDGGLSWGAETRLTNNSATSMHPFISASGLAVHVVWNDTRDGSDIYYKRNPTGNPVGINESIANGNTFQVFPNPFSNEISINSSNNELCEIIIYDINSRKVVQNNFTNAITLNTSHLAKGIYFYEVRSKNIILMKGKILKD